MNTHADQASNQKPGVANNAPQSPEVGKPLLRFTDNRPEAITQRRLITLIKDQPIQKKGNNTGLPDNLKSGIENLSGIDISDVKVHYNSERPSQLQAHAYAQGTDIHVAPGQEQHLPHEAWHVVQQKQGRVKPTLQLKSGAYVNDDGRLEHEADVMGAKAGVSQDLHTSPRGVSAAQQNSKAIQRKIGFEFQAYNSVTYKKIPVPKAPTGSSGGAVAAVTPASEGTGVAASGAEVKAAVTPASEGTGAAVSGAEVKAAVTPASEGTGAAASGAEVKAEVEEIIPKQPPVGTGKGFTVEADGGATNNEMEIVTDPVEETAAGLQELIKQMDLIYKLAAGIVHHGVVTEHDKVGVTWNKAVIGDYQFHVNGSVHFHPQATVGIKFEKIADLIDALTSAPFAEKGEPAAAKVGTSVASPASSDVKDAPADKKDGTGDTKDTDKKAALLRTIGWSSKPDQRPFRDQWKKGLTDAKTGLKGASDSTVGLASFFYGFAAYTKYIDGLSKEERESNLPKDRKWLKYFMPFMLRLGFLPHYDSLKPEERAILQDMPTDVAKTKLLPDLGVVPEVDGKPAETKELEALLIKKLLKDLGKGKEFLAREEVAGHGAYLHTFRELHMESRSDIGASDYEKVRQGAIIELRKLGNDVQPAQLSTFALAVFELVRLIHGSPAPPSSPTSTDVKDGPPKAGIESPAKAAAAAAPKPAVTPVVPPEMSPEALAEFMKEVPRAEQE